MRNYMRAALVGFVLSAIPIGAASAATCIYAPAGGTQCYETFIQVDPTTGLPINPAGAGTAGLSSARVITTATTNATNVKSSPGRVFSYLFCNSSAAAKYVRFFNLAVPPTVGSSPVSLGNIVVAAGSCQPFSNDIGMIFSVGISYDITAAAGDADATATTAGDVQGFIGYQ